MELGTVDLIVQALGAQVAKLCAAAVIVFAALSLWDLLKAWRR